MLGRQVFQLTGNIFHHAGVGVLVNSHSGGGVGYEDVAGAFPDAAGAGDITDLPGDVLEVRPAPRPDIQLFQSYPHFF